jgi:2-methylcitrate dehydratase
LAEQLAGYADRLRYTDLAPAVVEAVKSHVIDAVGCAIAAFDEPTVRVCREVVLADGGTGSATILGTGQRTSPDLAAFANGAAVRYYDLNDVYVGRQAGHPSDNIAPCFAVAEAEKVSGRDLIAAIALVYEVDCRFLDAFDTDGNGWDHPILSLPAVALAAGKLMRLAPDRLAQAVGLAVNDHIAMHQTRVQTLSDWKGVADAEAARNAVFAAMLARAGLTGPAPIFEGQDGFFKKISGPLAIDVGSFGGPQTPFRIEQCSMKPYPAQVYTQTAIAAGQAVARDVGDLGKITAIDIATTKPGYLSAGRDPEKWEPKTKETADHSLPYVTARAMLDGGISNASYTPEKLHEPQILALMRRIQVREDPALTALLPKAIPTRVTATLADGRSVTSQVDDMPGFAGHPMQRSDVERKFRANLAERWSEERLRSVLDGFWNLDRQEDLSALLGQLA